MNGVKRTEFGFTVREPTAAGLAATALYVLGGAGVLLAVPHPAVIPVTLAEIGFYIAAFVVAPALLRRHAPGTGRGGRSRRGAP